MKYNSMDKKGTADENFEDFKEGWIESAKRQSIDTSSSVCLIDIDGFLYICNEKSSEVLEFNKENSPKSNINLIAEFDCGKRIENAKMKSEIDKVINMDIRDEWREKVNTMFEELSKENGILTQEKVALHETQEFFNNFIDD